MSLIALRIGKFKWPCMSLWEDALSEFVLPKYQIFLNEYALCVCEFMLPRTRLLAYVDQIYLLEKGFALIVICTSHAHSSCCICEYIYHILYSLVCCLPLSAYSPAKRKPQFNCNWRLLFTMWKTWILFVIILLFTSALS